MRHILSLAALAALGACVTTPQGGAGTQSALHRPSMPAQTRAVQQVEPGHVERSLVLAAQTAEQTGQYQAAARHLRALFAHHPDDGDMAARILNNLRLAGALEDASLFGRPLAGRFGNNSDFLGALGKVELAGNRPAAAIEFLDRATALNSQDWRLHSALGVAHSRLGAGAQAQRAFDQALALSPGHPTIQINQALGLAMDGRLQEAIQILEAVPADPARARVLAILYALDGRPELALRQVDGELQPSAAFRTYLQTLSQPSAPF